MNTAVVSVAAVLVALIAMSRQQREIGFASQNFTADKKEAKAKGRMFFTLGLPATLLSA